MSSDLHTLIQRAFLAAKKKELPSWYRMNAGVLKNRLILLTDGQFDEQKYGYADFREFVEAHSDLLRIDATTKPITVELIDQEVDDGEQPSSQSQKRVRPDLWRAVTDYASGRKYVWDKERNLVLVANDQASDALPRLPTINADDLAQWRKSFLAKHKDFLVGHNLEKATRWETEGLAINFLPIQLRQSWGHEFSANVRERLGTWFRDNAITPPLLDLPAESPARKESQSEDLRRLVIQCVEAMTLQELEQLQLPASLLTRIRIAK